MTTQTPQRASRLSPAAMHALAAGVGEISRFPGVDELLTQFDTLVEQYPELATSRRIGTSRLGEPIPAITVGHSRSTACIRSGPSS